MHYLFARIWTKYRPIPCLAYFHGPAWTLGLFIFKIDLSLSMCIIDNAKTSLQFDEISVEGLSVPEEENNVYEWLQEKDQLEDLKVEGKMYSGPTIVEN